MDRRADEHARAPSIAGGSNMPQARTKTTSRVAGRTGAEQERLIAAHDEGVPWRKWGPYLSERQWGTVREDYSDNGDAWSYFSHEQAR